MLVSDCLDVIEAPIDNHFPSLGSFYASVLGYLLLRQS